MVRALSLTFAGASAFALWVGCADEAPARTVTQGCSLSSECTSPLVCAFAKCHQACKSSRDCSNGERCVQSDRPYYVCQKQGCARNSECLGKQICAPDGQCHDQCLTQKDCLADQVCTAGACADTRELVNGVLPSVIPDAGGTGLRCTLPTDCPGDLVCLRGGVCGAECIGDKDCLKTYTCKAVREGGPGRCFPPNDNVQDADIAPDATDAADGGDGGGSGIALPFFGFAKAFDHACALLPGGKVKCWGGNGAGQLGLGDTTGRGALPAQMGDNLPYVNLGTGLSVVSLAAIPAATCALFSNSKVKCWGANYGGRLGYGDEVDRGVAPNQMGDNLPFVDLGTGRTVKALFGGASGPCAVLDNDTLKCWIPGVAGPTAMGDSLPVLPLGTGRSARRLAMGNGHTCAILDNGRVKCWGPLNTSGQQGYGDTLPHGQTVGQMGDALPYVDLGTGRTATAISAGVSHTCAVLDDGSVKCWGSNFVGELGLGNTVPLGGAPNQMGDNLPTLQLSPGRKAIAISSAVYSNCALFDDASLKCWGENALNGEGNLGGQLGLGDRVNRGDQPNQMGANLPNVNLGTGVLVRGVFCGGYEDAVTVSSCATFDNNLVKCWGANDRGQLGLGDSISRGGLPNQMGDNLPYTKLTGP